MTPEQQYLQVELSTQGSDVQGTQALLSLPLRRYPGPGKPVLLLHGANTSGDIFSAPGAGLIGYLRTEEPELDLWVLEWRGSPHVLHALPKTPLLGSMAAERAAFTIAQVAEQDIVQALAHIAAQRAQEGKPAQAASAIGFCVGAGALSLAIAAGHVTSAQVDRVVLMTLGLFYEAPWDGWLKSQEFLLEQTVAQQAHERFINPFAAKWPDPLEDAFNDWFHTKAFGDYALPWYKRLTFMYGEPFAQETLESGVVDTFEGLFGPLHLGLYVDAVRKVRAARPPLPGQHDRDALARFADIDVLLMGGAQNGLWHRESLDLMYEWLLRGRADTKKDRKKVVLNNFAHLDLLWGKKASTEVYPALLEAIC